MKTSLIVAIVLADLFLTALNALGYTGLCGTMVTSGKSVCINQYGSRLYYEVATTSGRTELKLPVVSSNGSTFTARNGVYTYIANYGNRTVTVKTGTRVTSTIRLR